MQPEAANKIQREDEQTEIVLSISNEIARIRGKEDMLHIIRTTIKKYIHFDDSFILRYSKANRTGRPYIYYAEENRTGNPSFKSYLDIEYPVPDDSIEGSLIPIVYDIASLLPYGSEQISFMHNAGIKEFVVLKLIEGNQLKGLFILLSEHENSFTPACLDLLQRLSYQISIATANIIANEEIEKREQEKTILLSLSSEIAALRKRDDLFKVVNAKLKELFSIKEFGIAQVNEDQQTYSAFIIDLEDATKSHADFREVTSASYLVSDPVFSVVINSTDPVLLHVSKLAAKPGMPAYVAFWEKAGLEKVVCNALRVGGKSVGCAFFHVDDEVLVNLKFDLFKGVCAQLSVAVSNILANEKVIHQLDEINRYKQQLEEEKIYLKEEIETTQHFTEMIGKGPAIKKVLRLIEQVATSDSTVLLLGETGTGKELIARAIHNSSPRQHHLMVKVNCAALPVNLIESELFGHERGSFTGATERRIGKFELANNGTLFLDEIGEMPLELQVKLLRALQEKEIERVGGKTTIKVNVRIIAATNRNLEQLMEEGRFRSDLYYRLNIFPIHVPPLRTRQEDIPMLASHFILRSSKKAGKKITNLSNKVLQELLQYNWPGNIRELEHLIERSVLLTTGDTIKEIHLPSKKQLLSSTTDEPFIIRTIDENEREHILKILKLVNGRITGIGGAAELLGVPPSTLNSKIKRLGIRKEHFG